jgi:hypothetical protein
MVTGQLLQLSSAMSSGVLDIRHHFGCCIRHFFITFAAAIDCMNVYFLIMHQISTRNKRCNTFRANKIPWLNLTVKYSFFFNRFTRFCRCRC